MKKGLLFMILMGYFSLSFGQNIIFIGMNADDDGFAFLVLETISHPSTIEFSDGEGTITITTTGDIPKGEVVLATNTASATPSSTHGSLSKTGSFNISASGEGISANLTSPVAQQLSLITSNNTVTVVPSGYPNTIDFTGVTPTANHDVFVYTGSTTCSTAALCAASIQNTANWATDDGTGDQTATVNGGVGYYASIGTFSALPIILKSFSAFEKNETITLNWSTTSELNNDYMAIEHSTDGRSFSEIGRVQGAGSTNETQSYSFIDTKPAKGINYYRLRQVDFDGQTEYHKVIAVTIDGKQDHISIVPTAVQDEMMVYSPEILSKTANINIYDMNGRLWASTSLDRTSQQTAFQLAHLPAGHYVLRLVDEQQVYTARFSKM